MLKSPWRVSRARAPHSGLSFKKDIDKEKQKAIITWESQKDAAKFFYDKEQKIILFGYTDLIEERK